MSREINIEEKLSPEDHGHLKQWWSVSKLRRNAELLGVPSSAALRAEKWSYEEYESHVAEAEQKAAEPQGPPDPDPNAGTGSVPVPTSIGAQQAAGVGLGAPTGDPTPAVVNEEGKVEPRAFADPELAGKAYDDWKVEQLKAEVAKRNELRTDSPDYADEEPMSTDGLKADLVTRLTDDDEADAPE